MVRTCGVVDKAAHGMGRPGRLAPRVAARVVMRPPRLAASRQRFVTFRGLVTTTIRVSTTLRSVAGLHVANVDDRRPQRVQKSTRSGPSGLDIRPAPPRPAPLRGYAGAAPGG